MSACVLKSKIHLHVIHTAVNPKLFISRGLPQIHLHDVKASSRLRIPVHQPQKNAQIVLI